MLHILEFLLPSLSVLIPSSPSLSALTLSDPFPPLTTLVKEA